eukprot:TRINITY_DN871_c0_g1_i2.p1 TRINITY_DN871_c0_g1~~TRINITY_DN871_c0_g1_i2.p1  ORF type:complete len:380 (+),score=66.19 TRINITY_DN871_c0_g1_i2:61-1140(+)
MVAISLYRGNLHRVPDVPRRWPMPKHHLSLRDFKLLTRKRSNALSRLLRCSTTKQQQEQDEEEGIGDNDCSKQQQHHHQTDITPKSNPLNINHNALALPLPEDAPSKSKETDASDARNDLGPEGGSPSKDLPAEKTPEAKIVEVTTCSDVLSDKEKRKRELEKNLHILKEKKHQLVQALKQILNAEEEIKKRNTLQMPGVRPPFPLQMEGTMETGSVTKHTVPRISSEVNINGDLEGESEDVSNHNAHARHFHHMHSTSPSAASPLRRPIHGSFQHNMAPLTSRSSFVAAGHTQTPPNMTVGVTASPSRFAPSGHQGHAVNLPPLSVSGAHFTASSPSPAASSGTSAFRDSRLTSPSWN